jgi:hypothetical protein
MSFNRSKPDAVAKPRKPPAQKVPKTYERKAAQTKETENLAKARSLVIAEEKKRYNFLNDIDSINWETLHEFYESLNELFSSKNKKKSDMSDMSDDLYKHELYGNHLDMKRWFLFIEIILFLHENSINNDDENALSSFRLKPFTFGIDDKTSIQQLLTFIQKHKNLSRRFIEQHNKNKKSDDDDFDLFGESENEEESDLFGSIQSDQPKTDEELDDEFNRFYTIEDDIETRNSFGINLSDEGRRVFTNTGYESKEFEVIPQTEEEVKMYQEGAARFKELQREWQNRSGVSNVSAMRDRMKEVRQVNASIINEEEDDSDDSDDSDKDDDDKRPLKDIDRPLKYLDIGAVKRAVKFSQYFAESDAQLILGKIYERMMMKKDDDDEDATLGDYLLAISRIAVFVDENYLKSIAKTFNEKLSRQYYDLDKLVNLTESDILQEIYQHPDNSKSISTINGQITEHTRKYIETIMKILNTNRRPNEEDKESIKRSLKTSLETLKRSPSLTKGKNCSNEFSDVEDFDIIYYTDTKDGKVYCFKLFDLYEQFERKDFVNHKSDRLFNQTFIDNILTHKKPKSPIKTKEKSSVDDVLQSSLVDIFSETERGLDPVLKAEYEKEFGGLLFGA